MTEAKYISRRDRVSESVIHPFLRYQITVTEAEFEHLSDVGEISLEYQTYGNRYGFSRSALLNLLQPDGGFCIVFAVMSKYDLIEELREELIQINSATEIHPVLISADESTCLDRLARRLSDERLHSHAAFLAATQEYSRRASQIHDDIVRIGDGADFHGYRRIVNNKNDGGAQAMNEFYRFVVKRGRAAN